MSFGRAFHPSTQTQGEELWRGSILRRTGKSNSRKQRAESPPALRTNLPRWFWQLPWECAGTCSAPEWQMAVAKTIPLWSQEDDETLAAAYQKGLNFSQGELSLQIGAETCLPWANCKETCPSLLFTQQYKWKAGLVRFQISTLAKHVEKHRHKPHTHSLLWLLSQHCQNKGCGEKSSKAQLLKVVAASSLTL